ncbi:MAG: hypothetical protein LBC30_00105 [Puniceicoccales bacterium]|jgi:hypothetical protein|nr:hypothetical protein [Puniceicoccales bacterium]
METVGENPVQQAGQTGPAQVDEFGRHRVKVANFVSHMQGKKTAAIFDHSLVNHAALATAIDAGKSKITFGTKILTWLKTILSADTSYDTEIARLALNNIEKRMKCSLLGLAFQDAVSSANPNDVTFRIKSCAEICQAAGCTKRDIFQAISSITDPNVRVKIWKPLTVNCHEIFNWKAQNPRDTQNSGDFLTPPQISQGIQDLVFHDPEGITYVMGWSDNGLMDPKCLGGFEICCLADNPQGVACLKQLVEHNKLNLDLQTDPINFLADRSSKSGAEGVACLNLLFQRNQLEHLWLKDHEANQFVNQWVTSVDTITRGDSTSPEACATCLRQLIEGDKLQLNLKGVTGSAETKRRALELLGTPPTFEGAQALRAALSQD